MSIGSYYFSDFFFFIFQNLVTEDKKKKEEHTKKLSRNKKGDKNKAQNKVDSTPSKSQGQTRQKRKTPKSKTPKRERKKYDGYCPVCQMPFSALVIETPSWHAAECIDNYKPESGNQCSSQDLKRAGCYVIRKRAILRINYVTDKKAII